MKYKVGDVVQLKQPHSEGDFAKIEEVFDSNPGGYTIYIPYWDYFRITDEDIVGIHPDFKQDNSELEG